MATEGFRGSKTHRHIVEQIDYLTHAGFTKAEVGRRIGYDKKAPVGIHLVYSGRNRMLEEKLSRLDELVADVKRGTVRVVGRKVRRSKSTGTTKTNGKHVAQTDTITVVVDILSKDAHKHIEKALELVTAASLVGKDIKLTAAAEKLKATAALLS